MSIYDRIVDDEKMDKWNFYFPRQLKVTMQKKLLDLGVPNNQSALLRALVIMFVNGDINEDKLIPLIDSEILITPSGRLSKM
ncbi:MAG: hypothetical protein GX241_07670 [Ruminococcaceae bacterium]|nr:hypothetical protein [Oscillospiraceae bacterium]